MPRSPGTKQWWQRQRRRPRQHDDARRSPCRPDVGDADASRPGTTSRTATTRPVRLRLRRGRRLAPAGRPIAGSRSPNAGEGNGIDGTQADWTPATFDLSAYAGKTVGLRIRYGTDGARRQRRRVTDGIFVDEITITADGATVFSRRRRDRRQRLDARRLHASSAPTSTKTYDNYYIAGHRSYVSYDKYLKTGPYYFGYPNTRPDFVDHFAYQQGLLISYWDTSQRDNNTSEHPGQGRNLYDRRHPDADLPARRSAVADPHPDLRRAVQPQQGRLVHPAPVTASRATSAVQDGAAAVRRHQAVLRRRAAEPRRQAAGGRSEDPRPQRGGHVDADPRLLTLV